MTELGVEGHPLAGQELDELLGRYPLAGHTERARDGEVVGPTEANVAAVLDAIGDLGGAVQRVERVLVRVLTFSIASSGWSSPATRTYTRVPVRRSSETTVPIRDRLLDMLSSERIGDVAILGGDFHSSWAFDVPRNPWSGYQARTGEGSLAVEMLAPAVSSPPLFANPATRQQGPALRALLPHLKLLEGEANGYLVVDITRQRLLGEWFMTPTVLERTPNERRIAAFACERGSSRLATA